MPDAEYYRRWRAAHPDYRRREVERTRRRRAAGMGLHGDRVGQYRRLAERRRRASGDLGTTETTHPVLDEARVIVLSIMGERSSRLGSSRDEGELYWTTFEDVIAATALALLAGEDALEAARLELRRERAWAWRSSGVLDENRITEPRIRAE